MPERLRHLIHLIHFDKKLAHLVSPFTGSPRVKVDGSSNALPVCNKLSNKFHNHSRNI